MRQLRFTVGKTLPGATQLTGGKARIRTQDCPAPAGQSLCGDWGGPVLSLVLNGFPGKGMWGRGGGGALGWGEKGSGNSQPPNSWSCRCPGMAGVDMLPCLSPFMLVSLHGSWQTRKFLEEF